MTNLEQIKSELRSLDAEVLLELFYNVSDHIISRDLNDLLYNENPREIVRMMEYGDCKVEDDYFTVNGYGNLKSYSEEELKTVIIEYYSDEITEYLIKNPDQLREYLNV